MCLGGNRSHATQAGLCRPTCYWLSTRRSTEGDRGGGGRVPPISPSRLRCMLSRLVAAVSRLRRGYVAARRGSVAAPSRLCRGSSRLCCGSLRPRRGSVAGVSRVSRGCRAGVAQVSRAVALCRRYVAKKSLAVALLLRGVAGVAGHLFSVKTATRTWTPIGGGGKYRSLAEFQPSDTGPEEKGEFLILYVTRFVEFLLGSQCSIKQRVEYKARPQYNIKHGRCLRSPLT